MHLFPMGKIKLESIADSNIILCNLIKSFEQMFCMRNLTATIRIMHCFDE